MSTFAEGLNGGRLDAGIIVVPDDTMSNFLTDRTPNFRTAIRYVKKHAADMAVLRAACKTLRRRSGKSGDMGKGRIDLARHVLIRRQYGCDGLN